MAVDGRPDIALVARRDNDGSRAQQMMSAIY
jgi:hypothetical protein